MEEIKKKGLNTLLFLLVTPGVLGWRHSELVFSSGVYGYVPALSLMNRSPVRSPERSKSAAGAHYEM